MLPARAERELYDCALYIARRNPERALQWVDRTIEQMRSICELPRAHPIDEVATAQTGHEVRRRVLGNYLVLYHVDDAARTFVVEAFLHAARDR
jgi:plasmid stabilization system protein ParE